MAVYMIFKYSKRFRFAPSFNNLLSYCGLTDSRMRASDTDLPVLDIFYDYEYQ